MTDIPPPNSQGDIFADVRAWASEHLAFAICTLGLAVLGYMIGKLVHRSVYHGKATGGTAKKVDDVARDSIERQDEPRERAKPLDGSNLEASKADQTRDNEAERFGGGGWGKPPAPGDDDASAAGGGGGKKISQATGGATGAHIPFSDEQRTMLKERLLEGYNKDSIGWVHLAPKEIIELDSPLSVGMINLDFKGEGIMKVHISVSPEDMEKAIPILVDILYADDAPRVMCKVQTKVNIEDEINHQYGKEFALRFDQASEDSGSAAKCLERVVRALIAENIKPDQEGFVATVENMDRIKTADGQRHEKKNLRGAKFDRAIPCPSGLSYLNYRADNYMTMGSALYEDNAKKGADMTNTVKVEEVLISAHATAAALKAARAFESACTRLGSAAAAADAASAPDLYIALDAAGKASRAFARAAQHNTLDARATAEAAAANALEAFDTAQTEDAPIKACGVAKAAAKQAAKDFAAANQLAKNLYLDADEALPHEHNPLNSADPYIDLDFSGITR